MRKRSAVIVSVVFSGLAWGPARSAVPADVPWTQFRPTTTGIPGEEVRLMAFDPQGNLWVGARWPFQGVSGLAMLSADELPYTNDLVRLAAERVKQFPGIDLPQPDRLIGTTSRQHRAVR